MTTTLAGILTDTTPRINENAGNNKLIRDSSGRDDKRYQQLLINDTTQQNMGEEDDVGLKFDNQENNNALKSLRQKNEGAAGKGKQADYDATH